MKILLTTLLFLTATAHAQTPNTLSFALPNHPGHLSLDQGPYQVKDLSANPNGRQWTIRAEDNEIHFLGSLSVLPDQPNLNATSCREHTLTSQGLAATVGPNDRLQIHSTTGVDIALALIFPKDSDTTTVRAFIASADLCADLSFSWTHPLTQQSLLMQRVKDLLLTTQFDPQARPAFRDAFAYATLNFNQHEYAGAALAYKAALNLVDTTDDPTKWRRVTTDQLSMSLGISGDLAQSRAVNEAAIARDPTYPLYYYNLACADAEQGDATAARTHLQQAFDRRANTLPGEPFPDPTTDDSLLKLKSNPAFWTYAQSLSTQPKP